MESIFLLFNTLNGSKFFAGIMMVLLNLGAKYISIEISDITDEFFNNIFVKRFLIFCIFWMATRDIITSFLLTIAFILVIFFLLNHKSKFNLLTTDIKNKRNMKNQNIIPPEEIEKAKRILEIAHKQSLEVDKGTKINLDKEILTKYYNFRSNVNRLKNRNK